MQFFNRTATRLRKQRKSDELFYTNVGDLSVYPDAIRHSEEVQPITGNTRASVDYAGASANFITLVIEGSGFQWRIRFTPTSKLPDKIANLIATQAAKA